MMPLPTLRCIFWYTLWHFTNRSAPKHRILSQLLSFLMCKAPPRAISMHRHDERKWKAKSFFCRVRGLEPCFFIWLQMAHLPDFVSTSLDINSSPGPSHLADSPKSPTTCFWLDLSGTSSLSSWQLYLRGVSSPGSSSIRRSLLLLPHSLVQPWVTSF